MIGEEVLERTDLVSEVKGKRCVGLGGDDLKTEVAGAMAPPLQ